MPILSFEADHSGKPIVTLYVAMGTKHAGDYREQGLPLPNPLNVRTLIDTGASRSVIALSILKKLGLNPMGPTELHTPSTRDKPEVRDFYVVDLSFSGDKPGRLAENLWGVGSDGIDGLNVEMLLGRDVLGNCLLAYDGPNRRFTLAYDAPGTRAEPFE